MGWNQLAILKLINLVMEEIDDSIENSILKGLAIIAFFVLIIFLVGYVLLWLGFSSGNWGLRLFVLAVWIVIELANFIGGGHSER